jgi:hypothetical protein
LIEKGEDERYESLVEFFVVGNSSDGVIDVWLVMDGSVGTGGGWWWLAVVFVCPSLVIELCKYNLATEERLEIMVGLVRFVCVFDESLAEFVRWLMVVSVKGGESEVGVLYDG